MAIVDGARTLVGAFAEFAADGYSRLRGFHTLWSGDYYSASPETFDPWFPVVAWNPLHPEIITLGTRDAAKPWPPVDARLRRIAALKTLTKDLKPSTAGGAPVGYPEGREALQSTQALNDLGQLARAGRRRTPAP